jgi:NAD-dependent dihydropyrimidine dehydrogenase PreA subunit
VWEDFEVFVFIFVVKINKDLPMAIKITEECINCGACEPECPNNAIYEGGADGVFPMVPQ